MLLFGKDNRGITLVSQGKRNREIYGDRLDYARELAEFDIWIGDTFIRPTNKNK